MKLLNIGLIRYVIIMLGLILVSMFCFYMASTENVIENDEPLDISKATVEQISENKFIDVKITSTVCQLNKEKTLFDFGDADLCLNEAGHGWVVSEYVPFVPLSLIHI